MRMHLQGKSVVVTPIPDAPPVPYGAKKNLTEGLIRCTWCGGAHEST